MSVVGTILVTGLSALASNVVKAWQIMDNQKQRCLDREHAEHLQEVQHRHERTLAEMRKPDNYTIVISAPEGYTPPTKDNKILLSRMLEEAEELSNEGFAVAYEPMGTNFALALPLGSRITFVFILSQNYPYTPPLILLRKDDHIDHITFPPDQWQPRITLYTIMQNLIKQDVLPSWRK